MGLLPHYWEHGEIYALLRPFFMLPFVPVDEIIPCFFRCRRKMCKSFKNQKYKKPISVSVRASEATRSQEGKSD